MQISNQRDGPSVGPIEVDLFLDGFIVSGVTNQVSEGVRFGDVLNNGEDLLTLRRAMVTTAQNHVTGPMAELVIDKRRVLVAIPRETDEYRSRQRMFRAGMPRPVREQAEALVLLPPFAVRGFVHLPGGGDVMRVTRATNGRFFPVTDGSLYLGERCLSEGLVMLVNGSGVAGTSRLDAPVPSGALTPPQR